LEEAIENGKRSLKSCKSNLMGALFRIKRLFLNICMLSISTNSFGFWVVNFGSAGTLTKGKFGFAAGMGGQMVFLGTPRLTSGFFTIPHAGFRYGIGNRIDAGLRLAPIPLPFATVGPGFGLNVDVKYNFIKAPHRFTVSGIIGLGGAHVLVEEKTRLAYSPNAALLGTYSLAETLKLTVMARYVHLEIPTAPLGKASNFVSIAGFSIGIKKDIRPAISILPEIGVYNYSGAIGGIRKNGPGFQYGMMIATYF
jgi:hypothetical protein